mgnify:FL=1
MAQEGLLGARHQEAHDVDYYVAFATPFRVGLLRRSRID